MWKNTIPGQIPSWKESATIKLKHFFAKNCQNKGKLTQKLSLQTNGRQLKHKILQKVYHYQAVSDEKRKKLLTLDFDEIQAKNDFGRDGTDLAQIALINY